MTADSIRLQLTQRPFRPFNVYTAARQKYHVPHPDFAWISPSGRDFVVAAENDAIAVLSLSHVTEMQTAGSKEATP